MNPSIFREYDIRGLAEQDFDSQFALLLGKVHGTIIAEGGGRRVTVGPRSLLARQKLRVRGVRWLAGAPAGPISAGVQVRHRNRPLPASITPEGQTASVSFDSLAEGAAAPGQAAVFYDGETVLGGGWID